MVIKSGILFYKNEDKPQVLLVRQADNKTWGIPKGKKINGETLEVTAKREAKEEVGIEANNIEFLAKSSFKDKVIYCFSCAIKDKVSPVSKEIDKAQFLSLKEAEKIIQPEQKIFLSTFEKRFKNGSR